MVAATHCTLEGVGVPVFFVDRNAAKQALPEEHFSLMLRTQNGSDAVTAGEGKVSLCYRVFGTAKERALPKVTVRVTDEGSKCSLDEDGLGRVKTIVEQVWPKIKAHAETLKGCEHFLGSVLSGAQVLNELKKRPVVLSVGSRCDFQVHHPDRTGVGRISYNIDLDGKSPSGLVDGDGKAIDCFEMFVLSVLSVPAEDASSVRMYFGDNLSSEVQARLEGLVEERRGMFVQQLDKLTSGARKDRMAGLAEVDEALGGAGGERPAAATCRLWVDAGLLDKLLDFGAWSMLEGAQGDSGAEDGQDEVDGKVVCILSKVGAWSARMCTVGLTIVKVTESDDKYVMERLCRAILEALRKERVSLALLKTLAKVLERGTEGCLIFREMFLHRGGFDVLMNTMARITSSLVGRDTARSTLGDVTRRRSESAINTYRSITFTTPRSPEPGMSTSILNTSVDEDFEYISHPPKSYAATPMDSPRTPGKRADKPPNPGIPPRMPSFGTSGTQEAVGGLKVPRLPLLSVVPDSAGKTRSSRRYGMMSERVMSARGPPIDGSVSSGDEDLGTPRGASEEFRLLARQMGETYMTQDLATLIDIRRDLGKEKAVRASPDVVSDMPPSQKTSTLRQQALALERLNADEATGPAARQQRCKEQILQVMALITQSVGAKALQSLRSPVNLLFTELILSLKEGSGRGGRMYLESYRDTIYTVLRPYAEYTEWYYRNMWDDMVGGHSMEQKLRVRNKLDLVVWRIYSRMKYLLDDELTPAVMAEQSHLLTMLADYMRSCPTRVMSAQVVEVCMPALLVLKNQLFKRGRQAAYQMVYLRAVCSLFEVLDQIILQNSNPLVDDFLMWTLVERSEVWGDMRGIARQVIASGKVEQLILSSVSGSGDKAHALLFRYRSLIVSHFQALFQLMCRRYSEPTHKDGNEMDHLNSSRSSRLVDEFSFTKRRQRWFAEKMDFMISPEDGLAMRLLQPPADGAASGQRGPAVSARARMPTGTTSKKMVHTLELEVLRFLNEVFSTRGSPFSHMRHYTDPLITFHYLTFVKLYHSEEPDVTTIELCRGHLDVLQALATSGSPSVGKKFSQLRVMDFLVHQINLEYEVHQNRKHRLAQRREQAKAEAARKAKEAAEKAATAAAAAAEAAAKKKESGEADQEEEEEEEDLSSDSDDGLMPSRPQPPPAALRKALMLNLTEDMPPPIALLSTAAPPGDPSVMAAMGFSVTENADGGGVSFTWSNEDPEETTFYEERRDRRLLYRDGSLHVKVVQLLFALVISGDGLNPLYMERFPKLNIAFYLIMHMNHAKNTSVISDLGSVCVEMGPAYVRLLRLLSTRLFNPMPYRNKTKISSGAYGTIYECDHPYLEGKKVAVKLTNLPASIHDRCVLYEVYNEVLIMDKFKSTTHVARLYDFGVSEEAYWIVMEHYPENLREWCLRMKAEDNQAPQSKSSRLESRLRLYHDVLLALKFLSQNGVNHYDIKCDNFLVSPRPGEEPAVVVTDFGESMYFHLGRDAYTLENRGTEFIKSPEMLTVANAIKVDMKTYDRRVKVGAGRPSDVWSVGCLLYELLTGDYLFYDADNTRFFVRVTSPTEQLLNDENRAALASVSAGAPGAQEGKILAEFLEFILIRDPRRRPAIEDVISRFKYVFQQITNQAIGGGGMMSVSSPGSAMEEVFTPAKGIKSSVGSDGTEDDWAALSQRDSLTDLITTEEWNHFLGTCSTITDCVSLCASTVASKTSVLRTHGVTHVLNVHISPEDAALVHHDFCEYKDVNLDGLCEELLMWMVGVVTDGGHVLVCGDNGIGASANLIIGYLMYVHGLKFYDACVFLRERRRVVHARMPLVARVLSSATNDPRSSVGHSGSPSPNRSPSPMKRLRPFLGAEKESCQCLCGSVCMFLRSLTSLSAVEGSEELENPFECVCEPGQICRCPLSSCSFFLGDMNALYHYAGTAMTWAIGEGADENFSSQGDTYILDVEKSYKARDCWEVHACALCHFVVFARYSGSEEQLNGAVAVVTNIKIEDGDVPYDHRPTQFFNRSHTPHRHASPALAADCA